MAMVLLAMGNRPESGPTARMMGFSGPRGSAPSGHSSCSSRVARPTPPSAPSIRSGRWTTVARRLVRSIIKTRSKGSLTNIDNLLLRSGQFLQLEHIVRTVIDAVTAARANRRLLMGGVPDRRAKGTSADAVSAPDAELRVKTDAAVGAYFKRIGGTHARAGRVGARPARDDDEAFSNAPCRADPDSGSGETRDAGPAGTGKDTELTADTVVGIENGETFGHVAGAS